MNLSCVGLNFISSDLPQKESHEGLPKLVYARCNYGFTLIELVAFIVVMGIVGVTILASLNVVLRGGAVAEKESVAMQIATQCMEGYLEQRYFNGFQAPGLACDSPVPSFCEVPKDYESAKSENYTINTNVKCQPNDTSPTSKDITVTVSGADKGGNASLSLSLADY